MAFGSAVNINGCQRDSHGKKTLRKNNKWKWRWEEKLVLEQAAVFPAEIFWSCYKFGKGILRNSAMQLYPRVHFAIV